MLKINRSNSNLEKLSVKTLTQAKILERYDLQKMIVRNSEPFFDEMGENLVLIGQEVRPSELVKDSIDLLAVDQAGVSVVIELKRAEQKLQLLQALSYASMLSDWAASDFIEERSRFAGEISDDAHYAVKDHLSTDMNEINETQRVILIAEGFDYALLKTAEWLSEKYGISIKCYRLDYALDGESEYITCSCVYPPPEIADQSLRVRKTTSISTLREPATREEVLTTIQSEAVRSFFERNIEGAEKTGARDIAISRKWRSAFLGKCKTEECLCMAAWSLPKRRKLLEGKFE